MKTGFRTLMLALGLALLFTAILAFSGISMPQSLKAARQNADGPELVEISCGLSALGKNMSSFSVYVNHASTGVVDEIVVEKVNGKYETGQAGKAISKKVQEYLTKGYELKAVVQGSTSVGLIYILVKP